MLATRFTFVLIEVLLHLTKLTAETTTPSPPSTTTPAPNCPVVTCLPGPQVCGSDGATYYTECYLDAAKCRKPGLTKVHDGPCSTPAPTRTRCPMPTCPERQYVCGSNGYTYGSTCYLWARACEYPGLTLAYLGSCDHPSETCGSKTEGVSPCPPGQFCQLSSPKQYGCRSMDAKCGKLEADIKYDGSDIKTLNVTQADDCCDACFNTDGCTAFSFVNYERDSTANCFLKEDAGIRKSRTGVVSATIQRSCSIKEYEPCGNSSSGAQCCPENDYCQPWNSYYFQCVPKPAKCSALHSQMEISGDDLAKVPGVSPWECCDQCGATPGCTAYTYVSNDRDGPACYLKSGTGIPKFHPTAVSGKLN